MNMMETKSTDVLILGAGAAGIRAAVAARQGDAEVVMVAARPPPDDWWWSAGICNLNPNKRSI